MVKIKEFNCYYYNIETKLMDIGSSKFDKTLAKNFNYIVQEHIFFKERFTPSYIIIFSEISLDNTILTFGTFNFPF